MKTHRIILPAPWHARALAGATAVLLPMRPQPGLDTFIGSTEPAWLNPGRGFLSISVRAFNEGGVDWACPYVPGDVLMCREAWANPGLNEYEYKLIGGKYRWQPASRMLAAACRLWLRVVRREALRVADMTEEWLRAGWEAAGGSREDWAWLVEVKREER